MKALLSKRGFRIALVGLVALVACGDNLIRDPSFDLWCGDELCAPWQAKGKVQRVGTWHANDYGVSLANGTSLSQLSKHDKVDCIEFEVIADVDASASVHIEMDFQDDGVSEYSELVPESHWARLRYLVNTPEWYDSVRFIVRKQGSGRAVIAQIKATSSDECDGPELELHHQPNGAFCSEPEQCTSALCEPVSQHYVDPKQEHSACSPCDEDAGCASDEVCDVTVTQTKDRGTTERACLPLGEKALGAWCVSDAACESGFCSQALPIEHATCGECAKDSNCKSGEVCGLGAFGKDPGRSCHAPTQNALGAACAADQECESGVCCNGSCSECCADAHACAGGASCKSHTLFLTASPSLCAPGKHERERGDACVIDDDCHSGACDLDEPVCLIDELDCGLFRQLAGVCR